MARSAPRVSVLMPAFNAAPYIAESIESILSQSFKDFELVIIDDCSTDETGSIVQAYAKRDERIKASRNKTNLNISRTRNKLIEQARGEYIVWQDADDVSLPDRIKHQVEYMDAHPKVGICGGFLELFSDDKVLGLRKYPEHDQDLRALIFRFAVVAQPAAIIRLAALKEVGGFDLSIPLSQAEDLDMTFRIGRSFQLANLQEKVIRYRVHSASSTFKKLRQMEINTINIRRKYAATPSYKMTFGDKMYNIAQYLSIFIVPPKAKIWLFNLIRSSKGED